MGYAFFCEMCQKFHNDQECKVYDIIDTISGRQYVFECPNCDYKQTGFLELDIEEDSDAFAKAEEK